MPILAGIGPFGPLELIVILVIVVLVLGVGRLPEVGGAIGKSIREFRKSTQDGDEDAGSAVAASTLSDSAAEPSAAADSVFCGECGGKNARGVKFCSSCGHAIGAAVS